MRCPLSERARLQLTAAGRAAFTFKPEQCDGYTDLYLQVVHGLGQCQYIDGCSTECYALHLRLREHPCFRNYLNGHPYLCRSMEMLGEICDSDLAKSCILSGASTASASRSRSAIGLAWHMMSTVNSVSSGECWSPGLT